jgi:hypothetical protein
LESTANTAQIVSGWPNLDSASRGYFRLSRVLQIVSVGREFPTRRAGTWTYGGLYNVNTRFPSLSLVLLDSTKSSISAAVMVQLLRSAIGGSRYSAIGTILLVSRRSVELASGSKLAMHRSSKQNHCVLIACSN